jgi:diguanylate cyclase (GGDEF)-like protein
MATQDAASLLAQLKAARRLPSPPGTALRVLELCRSDQTPAAAIAEAIMCDPALAGRILKFANSPMSGAGRQVTTVRDAVMVMGMKTVKLAALGFALASPGGEETGAGFSLHQFWQESSAMAVASRRIAEPFFKADREEGFTVGLLSGIGRLALAQGLRENYGRMIALASSHETLAEVERKVLGVDHAHFGAQLLMEWKLPDVLVDAVRFQLEPERASGRAAPLAAMLRSARRLLPVVKAEGQARAELAEAAYREIEGTLSLEREEWRELASQIASDHRQIAAVFNIRLEGHAMVADLYDAAQEESTRVGMEAEGERLAAVQSVEAMRVRAMTDALTGVSNRAAFDEALAALSRARGTGGGDFALVMFDIDHFKKFNDTHGHQTGDLVLRRVAEAVRDMLPASDRLFRYGGEEFAILTPCLERGGPCGRAERLCRSVEALRLEAGGKVLGVTVSAGAATTLDGPSTPTELIEAADRELYRAKGAGRNTWAYGGRVAGIAAAQAA